MSEKRIQGFFEGDEGSYYALLAKVELAQFLDRKRLKLKEEKPTEILASEEHG